MAVTPNLGLELLDPGGLAGEDRFNFALNLIDAGLVFHAIARQNVPPVSPAAGDFYLIGPSPTDAWSGQSADTIAAFFGGWYFVDPFEGCLCYREDVGEWFAFSTDFATPTFAALKAVWSTEQHPLIGRRDGSQTYSKMIDVGALPNSTSAATAHGITGLVLTKPLTFDGFATDGSEVLPIPAAIPGVGEIGVKADATNVTIETDFNATAYSGKVLLVFNLTS